MGPQGHGRSDLRRATTVRSAGSNRAREAAAESTAHEKGRWRGAPGRRDIGPEPGTARLHITRALVGARRAPWAARECARPAVETMRRTVEGAAEVSAALGASVLVCSHSAVDHPPQEEDEDELRGTRGAAVGAANRGGAGGDGTQGDDGAVVAGRAHPIAAFWQAGGVVGSTEGMSRARPPYRPRAGPRARRLSHHEDAGPVGGRPARWATMARPGRAPAPSADRAGRQTRGLRSGHLALDIPDVKAERHETGFTPPAPSPFPVTVWALVMVSPQPSQVCPVPGPSPDARDGGGEASDRRRAFPESEDEGGAGP